MRRIGLCFESLNYEYGPRVNTTYSLIMFSKIEIQTQPRSPSNRTLNYKLGVGLVDRLDSNEPAGTCLIQVGLAAGISPFCLSE